MTYSESAEGVTITARRAWAEYRSHGFSFLAQNSEDAESFAEMINGRASLPASDVLSWLGY